MVYYHSSEIFDNDLHKTEYPRLLSGGIYSRNLSSTRVSRVIIILLFYRFVRFVFRRDGTDLNVYYYKAQVQ